MANARYIRGERGGQLLCFNDFIYKRNRRKQGKDYYNCNYPGCLVKLQTFNNALAVLQNHGVHGHPPPDDTVASTAILEEAKRIIDGDPTKGVPKIWDQVLDWFERTFNYNGDLPEFIEFKSTLYRQRAESLPPLPANVHDIDFRAIDLVWSTTRRGTRFLLKHDRNWGITIFSSAEQLQVLSDCRSLLADGTFKTAPPPYQQLYTIHGIAGNRRIPLVFALMSNKGTGDYVRLLQLIKRYILRATNQPFAPNIIVTDYELGIKNALALELPGTMHRGCLFHFNKCIFAKVQDYGLVNAYRNIVEVQTYIRKIMALPFLPILLLRNNYNMHKQTPRNRRLIRRYPALARLNLYFERTWLNGPFPMLLWNVYDRPLRLRTTNTCEGWHNRWNDMVARIHPNIWYLLVCLKREEVAVYRAIRRFRANRRPPPQRRRYRLLNERIYQYKTEYLRNIKTLDEYWNAIKYACHQF